MVTRREPAVLAIGPEGGWIERELETCVARGFKPVSLGAPFLRVEAAVASSLAQLALLFRRHWVTSSPKTLHNSAAQSSRRASLMVVGA